MNTDRRRGMIIIPLGLESKIFRLPWSTFCFTIVNLIISLQYFDSTGHLSKDLYNTSLLTNYNNTVTSLFFSLFSHADWISLLSNLIFLIFFGIYVELKMGSFAYIILYFSVGISSFLTILIFQTHLSIPMIEATSSIAGIVGAFTIFFGKRNVRVLLNYFFIFKQKIKIPVFVLLPFFIIINEIITIFSNTSNISFIAPLIGASYGVIIATQFQKFEKLPEHFIFQKEFKYFTAINQNMDKYKKLIKYLKILELNRENITIHQILIDDIKSKKWSELNNHQKSYTHLYLKSFIELQKKDYQLLSKTITKIDSTWPLKKIFSSVSSDELLKMTFHFEKSGETQCNSILIEALFKVYPNLLNNPFWLNRRDKILLDQNLQQKNAFAQVS